MEELIHACSLEDGQEKEERATKKQTKRGDEGLTQTPEVGKELYQPC